MRVRFAPSPTGALHIGGARTALYNWLLARGHGAEFVLRIEDTDRERSTPENVEQIFEALRWLGLDWDGDPVFQSERQDRHAEVVEQLIAGGHAYRSTAGAEEVKAYKEAHGNAGFRGSDDGEGAVRLRMPDEGATVVRDVIRGESTFEHRLMDDLVIARADGTPVYHLAVVVDDLDAGITHVARRRPLLQHAQADADPRGDGRRGPVYAHVPLLHGPDGKKLSKRHGAASVQELRDAGYLREAVLNLALLGWGYDAETTYHSIEELQQRFSLDRVSKSPAVFDEKKLRHMNGPYIRELPVEEPTRRLETFTGRSAWARRSRSRAKFQTLGEFYAVASSSTGPPTTRSCARSGSGPSDPGSWRRRARRSRRSRPWTVEASRRRTGVAERAEVKPGKLFQPLRVVLTGTTVSPGIFETVAVLGRDETLARMDQGCRGSTVRPRLPIEAEGRSHDGQGTLQIPRFRLMKGS